MSTGVAVDVVKRARPASRRPRLRRRGPVAAWVCAAVAFANALTFSLIVPAFAVPDEPQHYAYTEYLVQAGRLPYAAPPATEYSPEEQAALEALYFPQIAAARDSPPPWTQVEAERAKALITSAPSRLGEGGITGESDNPPAYYALEAIPYEITSGASFLARLEAMRIVSALLFAATVMFVFAFVRETLAEPRWAAPTAALAVAFLPQAAFIGGGINNDNLMFAAAAALFWLLARAFRRGLTVRLGALIGLVLAVGLLSKLTFIGLLPGVALTLILLVWRQARPASKPAAASNGTPANARMLRPHAEAEAGRARRWPDWGAPASRGAAVAVAVAAIPVAAYAAINSTVWHRSLLQGTLGSGGVVTGAPSSATMGSGSFREFLSYIWQFYLPRLPSMHRQFSNYPLWHTWIKGFVGDFGLLDYGFPNWVYFLALAILLLILGLAIRAIIASWPAFRRRRTEFISYLVIMLGLLLALARVAFPYHVQTGIMFEQARYLFPLLALYGLIVALAVRGAGRRWGPALAGALVVVMIGHNIFAQLLTLHRYWT